ncbi:MAG: pyruvate ferredoxin oxidoreductase gamma subunit [Kosmotoga sp.]|jgi:pyruvate ferredoxin oxidoreductase gamma subunit|nr:pyruvate ferredoxin oxidoreductase gamma subunit [Kosmotoga sp.]
MGFFLISTSESTVKTFEGGVIVPEKYFEVRWHGRAGQGAKSASQLLAEAALEAGMYAQSFPEYGAERSGAPMKAFNRISDVPIRVHHTVENPDIIVIVDDTLLGLSAITEGVKEDTVMIVNTVRGSNFVREKTGFKGKIFTIPATDIALEEIGRGIPNTVMIGALLKASNDKIPLDAVLNRVKKMFSGKLTEEKIEANLRAVRRGYEEVK